MRKTNAEHRTSTIEHRIEGKTDCLTSMSDVRCSVFGVRSALFCVGLAALAAALLLCQCSTPPQWHMLDGRSELRLAIPTGPMHLDPHLESEVVTNTFCHHIFDPLVFLDSNLKVIPCVASSWQCPNPLTWIFTIRPGIRFHDGSALTADDVVYSINRIRQLPNSRKKPILISVKQARVTGPNLVQIETFEPYMPLLTKLSQIMIVPAHYYRSKSPDYLKYHPVGSGPYRPVSLDLRREIVLEAAPVQWRFDRLFQKIRFRIVGDDARRSRMLQQGAVDFILEPDPLSLQDLGSSGRFRVVLANGIRLMFLGLTFHERLADGTLNPFRTPAVRQAVSMAIDRDKLVKGPLLSMAQPAEQMAPPLVFGYAPGCSILPTDMARARRLLVENHFPSERIFPCYYPVGKYFRIRETVAECARQLSAAGIRLEPAPVPIEVFFQKAVAEKYDVFVSGWLPISGDASDFFEHCFHSRGQDPGYGFFNYVGYNNPDLDRIIVGSTQTPDRERRLAILQQIMRRSVEDLVWIPLFFLKDSFALRRELTWRPRIDRFVLAYQITPAREE